MPKDILNRVRKYVDPFRVTKGKGFRLKDFDPADTRGLKMDKGEAADLLERGSEWLAAEQDILYAQDRWSLLLIFQAMDAAGKDGTIKHVMSRVNPQGCQVNRSSSRLTKSYRTISCGVTQSASPNGAGSASSTGPTMRRSLSFACTRAPEDAEAAARQGDKRIWDERLADIAQFEDYLSRQGVIVLKFYLNLSRKEQKKRFMERLDRPDKNWKFSACRRARAQILGRLHARLRRSDQRNSRAGCAMVRRAGRQQVVHPAGRRFGDR